MDVVAVAALQDLCSVPELLMADYADGALLLGEVEPRDQLHPHLLVPTLLLVEKAVIQDKVGPAFADLPSSLGREGEPLLGADAPMQLLNLHPEGSVPHAMHEDLDVHLADFLVHLLLVLLVQVPALAVLLYSFLDELEDLFSS